MDDVDYFGYMLGEMMVDKNFEITKMCNEPWRLYSKCKIDDRPWYEMRGIMKVNGGFIIK